MYLKYTVDGLLEEIVRKQWPEATEDELLRDYENVYEWVWLKLPQFEICLNVSREHEWGKETTVYPIYECAFDMQMRKRIDEVPEEALERIRNAHGCKVEVFSGTPHSDEGDGDPLRTV